MVIDFLIWDPRQAKVLLQKRAASRALYPNKWEIPGGHTEAEESPEQTIKRELFEELQCELLELGPLLHSYTWQKAGVRNDVYLIQIQGKPIPEAGKVTELRWVTLEEGCRLFESQEDSEGALSALKALRKL
jgi:8-oxo-dGTP pyrophosphatase MutT (NUDIX family)